MPISTEDINHKYLFNVGPSLLVELFSFVEKGWANVPYHPPPLFTIVALRRMFLFCLLLIKLVINYIYRLFVSLCSLHFTVVWDLVSLGESWVLFGKGHSGSKWGCFLKINFYFLKLTIDLIFKKFVVYREKKCSLVKKWFRAFACI